jgi:hypothetical protein
MSKNTMKEQLAAINSIMGDERGSYIIKGSTFGIKEDLKSYGWHWDPSRKGWVLSDVDPNDVCLKRFEDIPKTWIEKL